MTAEQFYDWQTAGGIDDVMRLVDCLERANLGCASPVARRRGSIGEPPRTVRRRIGHAPERPPNAADASRLSRTDADHAERRTAFREGRSALVARGARFAKGAGGFARRGSMFSPRGSTIHREGCT
jgi:hypothetical protein